MPKQLVSYDVQSFVNALNRILNCDLMRNAIDCYRRDNADIHPLGSHKATIKQLYRQLTDGGDYPHVEDRPHSDKELRAWLRNPQFLLALHRDHKLIVDVINSQIMICRVGWIAK